MKNFNLLKLTILPIFIAVSLTAVFGQQPDVARKTTAITYPLDDLVLVEFRGTTRFPRMKGSARVKRTTKTGTRIELSVEKMPRPFELGAGYATYVVWAISPTGQADNLGEIKRSGVFFIDSKMTVTTPLQTFAIIITAEPHFMVQRPSQAIMMENLYPTTLNGKVITTTPAIQYFGNSSDYFRDPRTPDIAETDYQKTPSAILQAKQAVALARYAGADRDASAELAEAETLLQNAINAFDARRDSDTVDITARKAISAAVKAESLAYERKDAREKRNEKMRADSEIRKAENRVSDAQDQVTNLKDELARETRNRELAERDALNFSNQVKDLRDENGKLREDLGRAKVELDNANAKLADLQRQMDTQSKTVRIQAAEGDLIAALKAFGTVVKNERGIVLTLPESIWAGIRSSAFAPQTDSKLLALAAILAKNPDYRIAVESHTDNGGDPSIIQSVTDQRAFAVADRFSKSGVEEGRIVAKGFGASIPVVPNTTALNRAKNRRMSIVLMLNTQ